MPPATIFEAVRDGNLESVKRLLSQHPQLLEARDFSRNDRTPLILACYYKKTRVVRYLLDQGADVNGRNRYGKTAAHYTCMNGNGIILNLLLEKGADVTLTDEEGYTCLMYAAFYAREQVMRTLLSKCPASVVAATVDLKLDADVLHTGKTALHLAAFKHFTAGVKLLLEEGGANPFVTDDRGRTALELVSFLGRNENVRAMEAMVMNAMREPERAQLLHKARALKEARYVVKELSASASATTTTTTGNNNSSGSNSNNADRIQSTEGEGEEAVAAALAPTPSSSSSLSNEQLQAAALPASCLRARLAQGQPLPDVAIADPATAAAQGLGMGKGAYLQARRQGELREEVLAYVVDGGLPQDLYVELQAMLRVPWEEDAAEYMARAAHQEALARGEVFALAFSGRDRSDSNSSTASTGSTTSSGGGSVATTGSAE